METNQQNKTFMWNKLDYLELRLTLSCQISVEIFSDAILCKLQTILSIWSGSHRAVIARTCYFKSPMLFYTNALTQWSRVVPHKYIQTRDFALTCWPQFIYMFFCVLFFDRSKCASHTQKSEWMKIGSSWRQQKIFLSVFLFTVQHTTIEANTTILKRIHASNYLLLLCASCDMRARLEKKTHIFFNIHLQSK